MRTLTLHPTVGESFAALGLSIFADACDYVHSLPYGRNSDLDDVNCVLHDRRGTCSTKHATLSRLARETGQKNWDLRLGIFRMDANTVPEVADVLREYRLSWLPEAHVFLRHRDEIHDVTFPGRENRNWELSILWECGITPEQVINYKRYLHQAWLRQHRDQIGAQPAEALWQIRQECIATLQNIYG